MREPVVCYRASAQPWMCDRLGHLNTRFYMAAFDEGMQQFFAELGYLVPEDQGWADVKHVIEYEREVPAGALFYITGQLTRVGSKAIEYRQELCLSGSNERAATCNATTVLFDLNNRVAMPAPEQLRSLVSD